MAEEKNRIPLDKSSLVVKILPAEAKVPVEAVCQKVIPAVERPLICRSVVKAVEEPLNCKTVENAGTQPLSARTEYSRAGHLQTKRVQVQRSSAQKVDCKRADKDMTLQELFLEQEGIHHDK